MNKIGLTFFVMTFIMTFFSEAQAMTTIACRSDKGPSAAMEDCAPNSKWGCFYKSQTERGYILDEKVLICYNTNEDDFNMDVVRAELEEEAACVIFDLPLSCHKKKRRDREECVHCNQPGPLGPDADEGILSIKRLGWGFRGLF